MSSSIPFDPSLVMMQVVHPQQFADLEALAEAQKPINLARDRLNSVLQTNYSMKGIYLEIKNLDIPQSDLQQFQQELNEIENAVVAAAENYGKIAITAYKNVEKLLNKQKQKTISYEIESPVDLIRSEIKQFPLAFDAIEFDVQYYKNEELKQTSGASSSTSHSQVVTKTMISNSLFGSTSHNRENIHTTTKSILQQTEQHNIEGTIVLSAKVDQKNADIIQPFVIDPIKAVTAWNYLYPDDSISVNPKVLFKTALSGMDSKKGGKGKGTKGKGKGTNFLRILTGCTKAASMVGFVHIVNQSKSDQTQSNESIVSKMKNTVEMDLWFMSAICGGYGSSSSMQNTANTLTSASNISNHVNLVCHGIIPSFASNEMASTVKSLAPDANQIMAQQAAIAAATDSGESKNADQEAGAAVKGAQFKQLNSEFLKNSVNTVVEHNNEQNKVIDVNSMMNAFADFIEKAMEGKSGVPKTFMTKNLTKSDIAKCYIKKFFPNGVQSTSEEQMKGQMGIASDKEEEN